jgi:5'-3' exoribonuclease 1
MGVPGLFQNLKHKYPNIIKKKVKASDTAENMLIDNFNYINLNPYMLFFDFNCLIHPICHLLWREYKNKNISKLDFEHLIFVKSIEYMEKVIEYAEPQFVYIFIDGVCPMAKMSQQRQRRFASLIDKDKINEIRKKFNIEEDKYYDTNSITPGTEFMDNFSKSFNNYLKEKNKDGIKFLYSSYLEPGEGEHKIIDYIKKNRDTLIDKDLMIYGLDADLIILSLTLTNTFKMTLLREVDTVSFDKFNMMIFDVSECSKSIIKELSSSDSKESDNEYGYIHDFIFITILLGNDFIPANPTLNMKFHNKHVKAVEGYNLLMDTYKQLKKESDTFITSWIDGKLHINWIMFKKLINRLAYYEQQYFETARNKYHPSNKKDFEIEIEKYEQIAFPISDPLKMYSKYLDYEKDRKLRFIHHYFGSKVCKCTDIEKSFSEIVSSTNSEYKLNEKKSNKSYCSQLYNNNIINLNDKFYLNKELIINQDEYDNVIQKYILTISYIMYYYYSGCPNNLYYYKYTNGILLSDLYIFLDKSDPNNLNKIMDTFYNSKINKKIFPLQQLLIVLPKNSYYLLPKNIYKIFEQESNKEYSILLNYFNNNYLSKNIKRDYLNKSKLYQASLILKMPKIEFINSIIGNIEISKDEFNRCLTIN